MVPITCRDPHLSIRISFCLHGLTYGIVTVPPTLFSAGFCLGTERLSSDITPSCALVPRIHSSVGVGRWVFLAAASRSIAGGVRAVILEERRYDAFPDGSTPVPSFRVPSDACSVTVGASWAAFPPVSPCTDHGPLGAIRQCVPRTTRQSIVVLQRPGVISVCVRRPHGRGQKTGGRARLRTPATACSAPLARASLRRTCRGRGRASSVPIQTARHASPLNLQERTAEPVARLTRAVSSTSSVRIRRVVLDARPYFRSSLVATYLP